MNSSGSVTSSRTVVALPRAGIRTRRLEPVLYVRTGRHTKPACLIMLHPDAVCSKRDAPFRVAADIDQSHGGGVQVGSAQRTADAAIADRRALPASVPPRRTADACVRFDDRKTRTCDGASQGESGEQSCQWVVVDGGLRRRECHNITMEELALQLPVLGGAGIDRPVVDETGLRLESRKMPLQAIVVDRVESPAAN